VEAVTEGLSPAGEPRLARTLVFIGFMGAGKSSAARSVGVELGVEPLDSDRELERELGETIEDFFDREGEHEFRQREEDVVLRLLGSPGPGVLALGGGSVQSERVREALRDHTVALLEVDPDDAWRRASTRSRPLARDRVRFDQLHADRVPLYESVANAILPPGGRDAVRNALPAVLALSEAPAGTRAVWAAAESGDYPVFFGRGLIASGFFHPPDGRRFVVTDQNVDAHHRVEGEACVLVRAGEEHKDLRAAEAVLRQLAQTGAERGDIVVGLGGGVVGDLAGFCAAVYQRGIRHVQVPTTVVAQVDSAYGGKTGVDLPEGKNYAGAFHQPSAVLCDPAALDTLPERELAAGYPEVVKTALIAGGQLWARVRQGGELDDDVLLGCARTKLAVVAADERDTGRRQVLNLGHTVGHAIEAATGYTRYRHGEAVGIGLLCALGISGRVQLRDEVTALLAARGLPLTFEGASVEDVLAMVQRDKKRSGGRVPFVLVEAPGEVTPGHNISEGSLRAAVEEVAAR
jgi:3-dehydroquinate synthetase/shikimate kinase